MKHELVSICLLTYNQEKYIEDTMRGILAQDYPMMELVIVDDASTDETVSIIREMLNKAHQFISVKLIVHEENTGNIPRNVNELARNAKGEYIKYVGGDDVLLPSAVGDLVDGFIECAKCAVVYGNHIIVADDFKLGEKTSPTEASNNWKRTGEEHNAFKRLMQGNYISAVAAMIRRSVYDKCGYHDEDFFAEDYEFWLRVSRTEPIYYINKDIVLYRRAESSVSYYLGSERQSRLNRMKDMEARLLEKYADELSNDEREEAKISFLKRYYRFYMNSNCIEGAGQLAREISSHGGNVPDLESEKRAALELKEKQVLYLRKWIERDYEPDNWLEKEINGYEGMNVAVYGLGWLGTVLIKKIRHSKMNVAYVIDKNAANLTCDEKLITLDDIEMYPRPDIIIISMVHHVKEIKEEIQKHYDGEIAVVDELLFRMPNNR